jgi:hypothetical protein
MFQDQPQARAWSMKKITKKARAVREQEIKWEIPVQLWAGFGPRLVEFRRRN